MAGCVLEASELSVEANGSCLLSDVSFTLEPGKILAVIGPNGAGKSSLLNAVAHSLPAGVVASGGVLLAGRDFGAYVPEQRARQLAVLPQHSSLSFPFSVAEVIAMGRMPHATGARHDRKLVAEAATAMDVHGLLQQPYTTLSGGEKQRVQLARVLVQIWEAGETYRLLLLDEPLAALDIGHQLQVMDVVRRFASEQVAVLMVLHDINMALRFADQVLALRDGRVLATGDVATVVDEALLQSLYDVPLELLRREPGGAPVVVPGA